MKQKKPLTAHIWLPVNLQEATIHVGFHPIRDGDNFSLLIIRSKDHHRPQRKS